MEIYEIIMVALGVIYAIALLCAAAKTDHFFKTLIFSALIGSSVFLALVLLSPFTGVELSLNPWSLGTSAAAGLPGVVGMLIVKLILI